MNSLPQKEMNPSPPLKCSKRVYRNDAFRGRSCARDGVVTEDGKPWCIQHAPSTVKKRNDVWAARYAEQSRIRSLQIDIENANLKILKAAEYFFDHPDDESARMRFDNTVRRLRKLRNSTKKK